jgi:thioesterase domain-containing protein
MQPVQPTIREALAAAIDVRWLPEEYAARMQVGFQAASGYAAGPYAGRVVLLRARTRPLFHGFASDLGWQKVVTGELEVREVPGNHETMLRAPHSRILARQLQAAIDHDQADQSEANASGPPAARDWVNVGSVAAES